MHTGICYYVDSQGGEDSNTGTSPAQAWKSLQKVNETLFRPGDRILFAAGSLYTGRLKPQGSGREGSPIVIDRYDDGPDPRIDGEGSHTEALLLYNVEYWEISNLEFTNTGVHRQAKRKGVFVHAHDFGTLHHIHLRNLYIHDVNGSNVKNEDGGAGIAWENGGNETKSRFDGLLIENCRLIRCDRCGITGGGYWNRKDWHPSLNVVIRDNLLEDIGGDGIVPIGTDGCLIEHNTIHGGRMRDEGPCAGIWPWSSDNTIIQHNEVSHCKGTFDGQGFDSDWNCKNTVIQYNYSHDNDGGFLLICNNGDVEMPDSVGNEGTVIRYNISVNDRCRTFHFAGPTAGTQICNNIIYIGKDSDIPLLLVSSWGGITEEALFANNIFLADGTARYGRGVEGIGNGLYRFESGTSSLHYQFQSNLYAGNHIGALLDPAGVIGDTRFSEFVRSMITVDGAAKKELDILQVFSKIRAYEPPSF